MNVFSFLADMNCFYLNTFHSVLTFSYFYTIANFDSHYHRYYHDYQHYYCCYYYYFYHCHCHYYFFIFIAFKDTKALRLYQLTGTLNSGLFNLFFWWSSFELTLLYPLTMSYFILQVFFNLALLCCWVACSFFCNLKFCFTMIKLLKWREIFVILDKLCVFIRLIFLSNTLKVEICFKNYIYIHIYK